ncbi:unnamed protein product [Eruca vesicaria subsp. sativa]|uniref:Translation initiation factor 5A C-terminal domain-containing protein n=1 Tax=Eruca vesicaria subsp. sativa TaxID=29727 RepID=A0ABC8L223_ERUVS|nr:unnamed protein product [Eruca vesicaria subsp. sativa]
MSDVGSSSASKIGNLRRARDIEISDHIDLSGKPCRVLDFYTKRGLCHLRAINILTGCTVRRIVPISTEFVVCHKTVCMYLPSLNLFIHTDCLFSQVPDVSRDTYLLTGISYKDNSVTLLHHSGAYTRNDIFLPENENLRTMMVDGFNDDKRVLVGVVTSLGQDAVYAVEVEVDQTGSDTMLKLDEDVLNQTITNDSDVVAKNVGVKECPNCLGLGTIPDIL